jgi:hypothetical protein
LQSVALLAWPVAWGETGVMSFMIDQHDTVYQANLGEESAAKAQAITRFAPDAHRPRQQGDALLISTGDNAEAVAMVAAAGNRRAKGWPKTTAGRRKSSVAKAKKMVCTGPPRRAKRQVRLGQRWFS